MTTALVALAAAGPPRLLVAQDQPRVVRQLAFEGNRALDDYILASIIVTTQSSLFASHWLLRPLTFGLLGEKRYFDELEFQRDVVRLVIFYRQSGYMSAVVDTVVRRTPRDVYITLRIHEGEPVVLERFEVLGVEGALDTAALKRDLPLQVGDPFNRALFLASADTVIARLRNRGYPYATILRSFDSDAAARRATATLEALPGPRMRVGRVAIEGLEALDTVTVHRMLSVEPGQVYRQTSLYDSQRDLYGTDLFRSVTVLLADSLPPADRADTTVRVVVRVDEGPRHRVRVGLGYGTLDCLRVQAGWSALSFLGEARTLELGGRLSRLGAGYPADAGFKQTWLCDALAKDFTSDTIDYQATATIVQPGFLSPRHTARVGLFAERRSEFGAFTRQAVGVNAGVTFNARRALPVTVAYGYSVGRTSALPAVYCSAFSVCDSADQRFLREGRRFAAVTATLTGIRLDNPLDPRRGSQVQASVMHASRAVGSDSLHEFNRAELEVAYYHPIGRSSTFAWRLRAGTILPPRIVLSRDTARFVPPEHRFYAGGPNSVRGYGRNELGPRVYVTADTTSPNREIVGTDTLYRDLRTAPTGGNSAFVLNAELRVPAPVFPRRLRLGLFVDVGQVWEREDELFDLRSIRVTPGVGLRIGTPLGPVRLDAAYNGYAREAGPLYFEDPASRDLTLIHPRYEVATPSGFWRRVNLQFAVGQAF